MNRFLFMQQMKLDFIKHLARSVLGSEMAKPFRANDEIISEMPIANYFANIFLSSAMITSCL